MRHRAPGGLPADRNFLALGFLAESGDLPLGSHPSDLPSERWEIVVEFHGLGQTSVRIDLERFKDRRRRCGRCGRSWCGWVVSWGRSKGESGRWYGNIGSFTSRKS